MTEGTPCTPSGGFDEPLTAANPLVSVTFTDAGAIDYFCIPHCGFGMTGSITVEGAGCAADVDGDGNVGFSDVLEILSA